MRRYTKQAFYLDIASRDIFNPEAGVTGPVRTTQVIQRAVFRKRDNHRTRGPTYPDKMSKVNSETSIRGTSNEECDLFLSNYYEPTTSALEIPYAADLPFGFNLEVDPASISLKSRSCGSGKPQLLYVGSGPKSK
ncbi:hypothetical protein EAE99_011617 [Botrytis elliptica]|nr:hypothetical protein EAE99_011617 [Botrytis elliptica]